jgi:prepilin-type processing-associated H-X9-DG protein
MPCDSSSKPAPFYDHASQTPCPDSINDGYFLDKDDSYQWTDLPAAWHQGRMNLSFADGHLETHKWRYASTKPPARPDAAHLPFAIPPAEQGDFDWLMGHMGEDAN